MNYSMKNITISEIAWGVFQTQLQAIQTHLDGCIEGKDPLHLHDLRVANRRIRAALGEFKGLLTENIHSRFKRDFRWLQKITGEVRDLDVSLANISGYQKDIPGNWRPHLLPMQSLLEGKREKAQLILEDQLASKRLNGILADWSKVLHDGPLDGISYSHESAREFGCRLIVKRYRKVRNKGLKLSKKTPTERFHAYRINIKRLWYLMEFLRPVIEGEDYIKLRTGLKSVQDAFGAFQDADVQTEKIEQLALELHQVGESAETLLAMGQLLGILEKKRKRSKKECLRQTRWLVGDSTARTFQSCFQYPVK